MSIGFVRFLLWIAPAITYLLVRQLIWEGLNPLFWVVAMVLTYGWHAVLDKYTSMTSEGN